MRSYFFLIFFGGMLVGCAERVPSLSNTPTVTTPVISSAPIVEVITPKIESICADGACAWIEHTSEENSVVLQSKNTTRTIASASADPLEGHDFRDLRFENGYLLFETTGWEWSSQSIYDGSTGEKILELPGADTFVVKGHRLVACSSGNYASSPFGTLHSLLNGKLLLDVLPLLEADLEGQSIQGVACEPGPSRFVSFAMPIGKDFQKATFFVLADAETGKVLVNEKF